MKLSIKNPAFIACILVAIFFVIALTLRVYFPYSKIFAGDVVKFSSGDAYYLMRQVDNLVHNFPRHMSIDPYFLYPGATGEIKILFFTWLMAAIAWVVGLGAPTQHTIDLVGAYLPAILGALTVVPVYFLGKELFGRWAGVLAAGLLAISSGEFLGRSILGFTDNHVAETLFTTITMLFLVLAIKTASQRGVTLSHLICRDWAVIARPAIFSLLAGISLGVYIFTWLGALLFVFIIAVFFVIQFIVDHLKQKSTDYLVFVGVITFLVALIISWLIGVSIFYWLSLIVALLIPPVLAVVSRLMAGSRIRLYYPLALIALGAAGLGIFNLVSPSLFDTMVAAFRLFRPVGASLTTMEMAPFLFPNPDGPFSTLVAWGNFTTSFFLIKGWPVPGLSFIALVMLLYIAIKRGSADKMLLVVWSLIILAATLGQRRFAYYLVVNLSLLTGYLSWRILNFAGFKEAETATVELSQKQDYYQLLSISRRANHRAIRRAFRTLSARYHPDSGGGEGNEEKFKAINEAYEVLSDPQRRAAYDRATPGAAAGQRAGREKWYQEGFSLSTGHLKMISGLAVVFFLAYFWNIGPAIVTAKQVPFVPTDAWVSSLGWMKGNTPEPFGDPQLYYQPTEQPPSGEKYEYPESAYGVLSWWDYGYWITRIARRLPVTNPSQDPAAITKVARFFTAEDEKAAEATLRELNVKYLIIDYDTAAMNPRTSAGKFWAVLVWAGETQNDFFDVFHLLQGNQLAPVILFHPRYYQSISTRLYNFEGQAVVPEKTTVISYQERETKEGRVVKQITSAQQFDSYQVAEDYLNQQSANQTAKYIIVGIDPFSSPVPLEALKHYRLVHSSDGTVSLSENKTIPEVKIFEYTGE